VQDRLRKLARLHGLIGDEEFTEEKATHGALGRWSVDIDFPDDIPLRLLNNFGLDLSDEDHREALEAEIAAIRPVLVVLDPLYLLFGGVNTDRAADMYPYLKWLLEIRNTYDCAIALVHHFSKRPTDPKMNGRRAGQRLLGSTTLHGWVDSALYCDAVEDDRAGYVGVRLEPEFRSMAPRRPMDMRLWWGEPGDLGMKAEMAEWDLTGVIVQAVREDPGVTAVRLAERLGIDKRTVLGRARDSDLLSLVGGKQGRGHSWKLYLNGAEGDDD
jgi:AAA domain